MKKFVSLAATGLAMVLFFIANVGAVQPYCWLVIHEPDIPEALK